MMSKMTERIKITEELLKYFERTVLFDDGFYLGNFEDDSEREFGQKVTWEMMRKQILENQKIVDEIKRHYEFYENTPWTATDEYSNVVTTLIKNAIGKYIKEL